MGNSTTFLTIPAAQRLGTQVVYAEREIDFTVENLASGSTMDVLKLPKGAVPLRAGWITKTVNNDASAKIALSCPTANLTLVAAAVLGIANAATIAALTTSKVMAAEDTVRITASVADLAKAKIVVFIEYAVSDACRN
ncbi:MAG TPA: hypothetical protein PLR50_04910 [Candidatus Rifleibacterium sp.]|nr:hypothetical protein [Candidatus Rifleibacterium sp.]